MNNFGLGIRLVALDHFSKVFDRLNMAFIRTEGASEEFVAKMQRNQTRLRAGFALLGASAAGLGISFAATQQAGKFEGAMANLQVISQANAKEMDNFSKAAINADKSMFGPTEMAQGMREIAQAGFTAQQTLTMLKPVLDLAQASMGELGVAQAAQLAAQTIHAFGMSAEDAVPLVDKLAKISNVSALSFRDLPIGIGVMARGAKNFHQNFDEALITLALVRNTIPTIERASHAATIAMERMSFGRHTKFLEGLGEPFDKVTGQARPFLDVVNEMLPKLSKMTEKQQGDRLGKIFGAEGLAGIQAVMTQLTTGITLANGEILKGSAAIEFMRKNIKELSAGTAAIMTEAQLNTWGGQVKLLTANFERLMVVVGEPFLAILKPLVTHFSEFVTWVKNGFNTLPDYIKKGAAAFFMLGSAILGALGAGLAINAVMTIFGVTFAGIGATALALAGPLAVVAAAIAGIILLVQALRVHSQQTGHGVIEFFIDMGRKIKLAFQGLVQVFTSGAFSGEVMLELNRAENSGVKAFAIKVYVWANRIKNFLAGLADGFREKVKQLEPVFTRLADVLRFVASMFGVNVGAAKDNRQAWEDSGASGKSLGAVLADVAGIIADALVVGIMAATSAVQLFMKVWDGIGPIVKSAARIIWGMVKFIVGVFSGDWKMAWDGAFDLVFGLIDMAISMVGRLIKMVTLIPRTLAGLVGINLGFSDMLDRELDAEHAEVDSWRKSHYASPEAPAGPSASGFTEFLNRSPVMSPASPTAMNSPAIASSQVSAQSFAGFLAAMPPAAQNSGPGVINIPTVVQAESGETLIHYMQRIQRDAISRGYLPVSPVSP